MKLLNSSIAVLLLSLATFSSVSEAKFAPTTFVGKSKASFPKEASLSEVLGEPEQEQARAHPKSKSKSLSTLSSLMRLAGGSTESLTPAFTFYMDVFLTGLTVVFMALWFKSMNKFNLDREGYEGVFPNFDRTVLDDGFCIHQEPKETLFGLGTLKLCGIADLLLVISSYFKYKDTFSPDNKNKLIYFVSAGYTLLHGAVHFFEIGTSGKLVSDEHSLARNVLGVVLLAAITAPTLLGINDAFDKADKKGGMALGIAAWIGFAAFFALFIQYKVFALTFINATIFLSIFGARALVLDKDDERRLNVMRARIGLPFILAATANIVVMFFEPLVCENWFASVGGHIWFDVTLWILWMSVMQ